MINALLNRLPSRKALLQLLERELATRNILSLHHCDLEFLRKTAMQFPKSERVGAMSALAELLKRVHEKEPLFVPREEDGYRGRKWNDDFGPVFIIEGIDRWLRKALNIRAQGNDYTIEMEPGQVAVTVGGDDFEGVVPPGEFIESAQIVKLPELRIIPILPAENSKDVVGNR